MDYNDDLEKYHKMIKEEDNFNYNYHKLLSPDKNNKRRKLSQIFLDNINIRKLKIIDSTKKEKIQKHQNKFITDNSLIKRESILQKKFLLEQIRRKKEEIQGNKNKIKGYFTKSHCPFCNQILSEKGKEPSKIEKMLIEIIRGDNFPLISTGINKYYSFKSKLIEEKKERMNIYKKTYDKKIDIKFDLNKNKSREKYKLIKREEIKVNNLYKIEKPLLMTMRGIIYKNTRQRYKKPLRLIILDS